MRLHPLVLLLALASLVLAACGGTSDAGADGVQSAPPTASSDGDTAAGGTTMRVYTVEEVVDGDVTDPVHVSGLLIDDGSGWRLCNTSLESYPPQCGEPALQVEGLNGSEFTFEEAQGVRWIEAATLVGDVEDGAITVTGSAATS